MTQLQIARKGEITKEMTIVAQKEGHDVETIREGVAKGQIVIPANINHKNLDPCGLGKGLSTKVNANIGTSSDYGNINTEPEKLRVATDSGADTVMDLSTGGDIPAVRQTIMAASSFKHQPLALRVMLVPVYQIQALRSSSDAGGVVNQFSIHT